MLNIDATYRVNYENYPLYAFIVQDQSLRGLPIAFCLMRRETTVNMEYMYQCLSTVLDSSKCQIIMVDKDLQNLDLIREYFPNSRLLLCTFHVIKYIRSILSQFSNTVGEKKEIMTTIINMIYAKDQEEVNQAYNKIKTISLELFR